MRPIERPDRSRRVECGPDGRPVGRDTELVALLAAYQDAVVRSPLLDPTTTELVRLRCARQHDCRICQTLRLADAREAGADEELLDQVDFYESSGLSERHKVALRIVDAVIWRPADISDQLVTQARAHFTQAELAELLVDITKWSTQKIHVTLGTDGAERLTTNGDGVSYFAFGADGTVASLSVS
jgi:AhpD family alkylhydroperoxidase